MSQENVKLNIPLLNGGNFVFWKTKLKAVLVRDELWEVVNAAKPENANSAWDKKNNRAMACITLSVEDNQLIHFAHLETAHEAWAILMKKYERSTFGSRLYLRRKLYSIQYRGGPMDKHIDTIMEVVGLLRGSGKPLENDEIVAVLLVSLPESYSGLVIALEGRDETDLTIEYVTGKMMDEYQRRTEISGSSSGNPEVAMKSTTGGKSHKYKNIFKGQRQKSDSRQKDERETRSCFHCHKPGHLKADCRWYKRIQEKQKPNQETANATVVETEKQYVAFNTQEVAHSVSTMRWCIDSGATSHMTNDKSFFSNLRNINMTVYLADHSLLITTGIGEGYLCCTKEEGNMRKIQLQNVLYIPKLADNLISVRRINEKGYKVLFENKSCKIYNDKQIIAEGEDVGNVYRMKMAYQTETVYITNEGACIHQWHRRLGQRDPAAIRGMVNENQATGIKILSCSDKITCEHCIKGKFTQAKFSKSRQREKEPMRLIHSDLCGPMQTATPRGNRYFLTLIDDYSRFTVVRLVKTKDEVAGVIKEYVAAMSTRFGRKPMAIRTDNGREYISFELEEFLKREGIEHKFTVVYTPQQNGVAERKNRSLTESAKCMLLDAELNNRFWGEAVLTATYLQNRIVSRSINKTPLELFTGVKPDFSNLRIFGSKVYSLIPKQKRKKWDDKAEEGVLVGYHEDTKGYRILDPSTDKVWISRSVRIIENNNSKVDNSITAERERSTVPSSTTVEVSEDNEQKEDARDESDERDVNNSFDRNHETSPFTPEEPQRRVSGRINKNVPPLRLVYKISPNYVREPKSWNELIEMPLRERELWLTAAKEEIKSLNEHEIWELTSIPPGKRAISCKWVFKGKVDGEGKVHTYKARLVARGFSQRYGEDYDETFAPVVRHETIRVLLVVSAQKGLHIRQVNVKSAYLNGKLEEEIFMEQPEGFVVPGEENKVLRLKRSLYGLKQSARVWNKTATEILVRMGFKQGNADPCLYSRIEGNKSITYILLYVDDLLIAGESEEMTEQVCEQLQKHFKIKDLGNVNHYLGIQIEREPDGSFLLNQKAKIIKLLDCYSLLEPKPAATPMEPGYLTAPREEMTQLEDNICYRKAMGSLLYIATVSRPDIAAAVGLLCRRVEKPTNHDWRAVKRVMQYLASTIDYKLKMSSRGNAELKCYVDADWAGDKIDRKSTSGYVFLVGEGVVAWSSRKQTAVAMSSTEAEYISASLASRELLWFRQLFNDMNIPIKNPTTMFEDNQGCIKLIESDRTGGRTKHIDVCYHQIRDLKEKNIIDVQYCPTEQMLADIFTKPLTGEQFKEFLKEMGLKEHEHALARRGVESNDKARP